MLNDIKTPPPEPEDVPGSLNRGRRRPAATEPGVRPHAGIAPHTDPAEPGTHHARIMGDATRIDPVYETPLEDRGSTFSIGLTIAACVIVAAVVLFVAYTIFR